LVSRRLESKERLLERTTDVEGIGTVLEVCAGKLGKFEVRDIIFVLGNDAAVSEAESFFSLRTGRGGRQILKAHGTLVREASGTTILYKAEHLIDDSSIVDSGILALLGKVVSLLDLTTLGLSLLALLFLLARNGSQTLLLLALSISSGKTLKNDQRYGKCSCQDH
jgi:hypothetical protein